ncbi:MAG: helix-turn-helix domain-containing protein, partial [Chloroflexia bacterium]
MSNKADAMERVRELARQHPGWTPSQIALYLQGEGLAVTNEDVRRTLTRRTPVASTDPGVAEAPTTPQYAAPREEPRRSAIPTGLLFGVILFVVAIGAPYLLEGLGAAVSSAISLGLSAVVRV